jgi:hypothetical protein
MWRSGTRKVEDIKEVEKWLEKLFGGKTKKCGTW